LIGLVGMVISQKRAEYPDDQKLKDFHKWWKQVKEIHKADHYGSSVWALPMLPLIT
jgi:hypothetical protein